ncbi:molybdopterin-dependent oxidoreductase [Rhizobium sp. C4]|uniref:molybdopterin-dependent oxidoreductase n=1 Tax=Rhizobium sp. C4 TaxID=1349800 RepID=UPI001E583FB8|nr:molybdopterin-dependent oxidoreductase [Rhizobium sp. C4]MCD2175512.1 molybdopterin-dependent oxidoreductase [Rhizobium sp. C4]
MSGLSATHWGFADVEVRAGKIVRAEPFHRDESPSPLLKGLPDAIHASTRVLSPAIREGWLAGDRKRRGRDRFIEVDWQTAYDHIERTLRLTLEDTGNEGIFAGSYGWGSAGRFHHAATHLKRFLNTIGGFVDQKQTYSFAAGQIICPHVVGDNRILFGGETTTWPAILDNARIIVFFGGINISNAQIAAGGLGNHATLGWLNKAAERGIEIVCVSPRRDDDPRLPPHRWVPIRPGSDTALMLALAYEVVRTRRIDRGFLASHTKGYDRFEPYLLGEGDGRPKNAAWAAELTGIPEDAILELARKLTDLPSFLTAAWALQRQENGEQPLWMLIVLSAMLGEFGKPGRGVSFGYGSIGNRGDPRPIVSSPGFSAGRNPLGRFIPVARVADMLLGPGETIPFDGHEIVYPKIDMVWWAGGNPFHHHQDLNRLVAAFQQPRTVIVNEIWWTATARHADIVLPATSALERNDLSGSPTDRFTAAMRKQIEPLGLARSEFDIFSALAERFGTLSAYAEGLDEMGWLRRIYEEFRGRAADVGAELPDFDAFWKVGYAELPPPNEAYTLFEDFHRDPVAYPLKTPSGKIEIWSRFIAASRHKDIAPHPFWSPPVEWLGSAQKTELHLISPQPATRLHSQLDGVGVSLESKMNGREPIFIHPQDAEARGIVDGDLVQVWNDRGQCLAGARLSEAVMPQVVALATGAWFVSGLDDKQQSVDLNGNPNVLTGNRPSSSLSQAPAQHSVLVRIEKYADASPALDRATLPEEVQSSIHSSTSRGRQRYLESE